MATTRRTVLGRAAPTWCRASAAAVLAAGLGLQAGCHDPDEAASAVGEASVSPMSEKLIRGRVTDVRGEAVGDLEVLAEGVRARTDSEGRFELSVAAEGEVRLEVTGSDFSDAELPVTLSEDAAANVELSVMPRARAELELAEMGGVVRANDGVSFDLPRNALRHEDDTVVRGPVDIRYTLVNRAEDVLAAPGRMQAGSGSGLDGFGMMEVRFYQDGERLRLADTMEIEVPLYEGHPLSDGDEVSLYRLGRDDLRWQRDEMAMVASDKVVIRTARDAWIGAARAQPTASCVKGSLSTASEPRIVNTTIRAARERGLSLIQSETSDDGSFCLPVTPDDDWAVSTFYTDGENDWGIAVDVRSDEAAGMCGGDSGCKDVGAVELPRIAAL